MAMTATSPPLVQKVEPEGPEAAVLSGLVETCILGLTYRTRCVEHLARLIC